VTLPAGAQDFDQIHLYVGGTLSETFTIRETVAVGESITVTPTVDIRSNSGAPP